MRVGTAVISLVVLVSQSTSPTQAMVDVASTGSAAVPTMSAFLSSGGVTFQASSSQQVLNGVSQCEYREDTQL